MWAKYFNLLNQHFIVPGVGEFNANDPNIKPDKLWNAYQRGSKSVELTDEGRKKYIPESIVKPTKKQKDVEDTNLAE